MDAKVRKWGNSLGIRIPRSVADDIGLSADSVVSLEVEDGLIVLRPKAVQYTLDGLLAAVTRENLHKETEWGKAFGKEIW